jgi:hypothetical protein
VIQNILGWNSLSCFGYIRLYFDVVVVRSLPFCLLVKKKNVKINIR